MRVLVCGSRYFNDEKKLEEVLTNYPITSVVEGGARGADTLGRRYAERRGIPITSFPAEWDKYGKAAGPIRNNQMLVEGRPELVIAFRGENSRGTQNMIDQAMKAEIETIIVGI